MTAAPIRLAIAALTTAGGGAENLWRLFVTDPTVRPSLDPVLLAPHGYRPVDARALAAAHVPIQELAHGVRESVRFKIERRLAGDDAASRTQWQQALLATTPELLWINIAGMGELDWAVPLAELCRARALPYWIILQHAEEDGFFADDQRTARARAVIEGAARVLFVSERNRRALERAIGASVPQAMRGVNGPSATVVALGERVLREAAPRTSGTVRFRSLARFDLRYKGQDLLLAALATDRWRERDWTLVLQGGGPHRELLERLIARHDFAARQVTVLDRDEDLDRAFRETDLLVMPSRSEGSPFALVEAMVCGRPAVVTPVGGNDELVRDQETGWVSAAVSADAFGEALEGAWNGRERWVAMGTAARAHALAHWELTAAHQALLVALREDHLPVTTAR